MTYHENCNVCEGNIGNIHKLIILKVYPNCSFTQDLHTCQT